jgi:uncharacterized integral membrane protein
MVNPNESPTEPETALGLKCWQVGLTTFQDAKPRTLILAADGVSLYDTDGVLVIRFDPTKTSVRAFGDAITFSNNQGSAKEKFMLMMTNSSFSDVAANPALPGVHYATPLDMSAQALAAQLSNLVGKVGARVSDGLGAIGAVGAAGPLAEGLRTMQAGSAYNAVVAEFCSSLGMTVKGEATLKYKMLLTVVAVVLIVCAAAAVVFVGLKFKLNEWPITFAVLAVVILGVLSLAKLATR